jgi:peptide deformylase
MIYDLVKDNDPVLHEPCQPFDFNNPPIDPYELAQNLKETMIAKRGVGLSANQVGLPYRVMVIGDPNDPDNIMCFFNPRITSTQGEDVLIEEGCLSYPGLFIKIKRPQVVRMRFSGPNGAVGTNVFEGIPARIILHEYDHMEGVVFTERASRLQLQKAKKQKVKLDRIRERNLRGKVA